MNNLRPSQLISSHNIDDAYDKLYAENKRLREALENIHTSAANVYGRDSQLAVLNLASIAREALENASGGNDSD